MTLACCVTLDVLCDLDMLSDLRLLRDLVESKRGCFKGQCADPVWVMLGSRPPVSSSSEVVSRCLYSRVLCGLGAIRGHRAGSVTTLSDRFRCERRTRSSCCLHSIPELGDGLPASQPQLSPCSMVHSDPADGSACPPLALMAMTPSSLRADLWWREAF